MHSNLEYNHKYKLLQLIFDDLDHTKKHQNINFLVN